MMQCSFLARAALLPAALIALSAWSVPAAAADRDRPAAQAASREPAPGPASYRIFLRGNLVGSEDVTLSRGPEGFRIVSSGSLGAPFNFAITRFELRYGADWQPLDLVLEAAAAGRPLSIRTTFGLTHAVSDLTQAGQLATSKTDEISVRTVVLPNNVYAAYEALAARLSALEPGAELRAYVVPQGEAVLQLRDAADDRIETAGAGVDTRRHSVTVLSGGAPREIDIWSDRATRRLLRLSIPSISLEVAREDIATATARLQTVRHTADEDVTIGASGFNLAATITRPAPPPPDSRGRPARLPAVVLVPGTGLEDREETRNGVPVFGQLAGSLADAGFLVVRYDKRGVGQSGGRFESATLADYGEDARAVIRYLSRRRDVDRNRIALVGYADGGWVALLAASRERRLAGVALLGAAGTSGADLVLEQQRLALDRLDTPEAERQAKIALQEKIHAAVTSRGDWAEVPPALRRQADTPVFRSLLTFDPAQVVRRVRAPILVLHGAQDRQVPAHHADRLEELARARRGSPDVETQLIEGVDHLFVAAGPTEVSVGGRPADKRIADAMTRPLAAWLQRVTGARR